MSAPPLKLATGSLPTAVDGVAYSVTLSASGGTGFYKWAVSGLPAGMSLNGTAGVISGVPAGVAAATDFPVTIKVTDGASPAQTASATLTLTVNSA